MSVRVGYVVSRFPKLSETFVLDEVLALEKLGADVSLAPLLPSDEAVSHPQAVERNRRALSTGAAVPLLWLAAQAYWAVCAPTRLFAVWSHGLSAHRESVRSLSRAVLALLQASRFALWMQRRGVEHVHAHWATHTALAAWAIHRLTGLSYSFTAHADDIFIRRPMLEEKIREAAFVVTISEYNQRYLVEQLGRSVASRIRVVRCGIDTGRFRPTPPSRVEVFTIACVARLEPKKGHGVLLDACAELARRDVPFRCVLVGDGSERAAITRQRAALGLEEQVELIGVQPRDGVCEVLEAAHVVVLPGIVESSGRADGIPVALMEALATERPVVASDISGIPELVEHEHTGLLVPSNEPLALADALNRLRTDPELGIRLAAAGRLRVLESFDVERNARRLLDLFEARSAPAAAPASAAVASGAERSP